MDHVTKYTYIHSFNILSFSKSLLNVALKALTIIAVGLILFPILKRYFLKDPFVNIPGPPSTSISTGDFDVSLLYIPRLRPP